MVGLLEAGEGEGTRDELAGFGGRGGGRLVWVEGAAVVFWRAEFVAGDVSGGDWSVQGNGDVEGRCWMRRHTG